MELIYNNCIIHSEFILSMLLNKSITIKSNIEDQTHSKYCNSLITNSRVKWVTSPYKQNCTMDKEIMDYPEVAYLNRGSVKCRMPDLPTLSSTQL